MRTFTVITTGADMATSHQKLSVVQKIIATSGASATLRAMPRTIRLPLISPADILLMIGLYGIHDAGRSVTTAALESLLALRLVDTRRLFKWLVSTQLIVVTESGMKPTVAKPTNKGATLAHGWFRRTLHGYRLTVNPQNDTRRSALIKQLQSTPGVAVFDDEITQPVPYRDFPTMLLVMWARAGAGHSSTSADLAKHLGCAPIIVGRHLPELYRQGLVVPADHATHPQQSPAYIPSDKGHRQVLNYLNGLLS